MDPLVKEWANRSLENTTYNYLFVDAMYIKVREKRRVISKAVYIGQAITDKGAIEIVGFSIQQIESYEAWKCFLQSLLERGMNKPKLVISDAHEGLKKAIQEVYVGTGWQRCTVHFKRNINAVLSKKESSAFRRKVIEIFNQPSEKKARESYNELFDMYEANSRYEKALGILEAGFEDAIQFLNEPENVHRFIKSTNHLERTNQEVRRRKKVIRIFPNQNSAYRLVGAVLLQIDGELRKKKRKIKPEE